MSIVERENETMKRPCEKFFSHRRIRQLADWEFHMAIEKQNYKQMKDKNP